MEAAILIEAGPGSFGREIRAAVRGLWRGVFNVGQFFDSMTISIERHFTRAWHEGAKECGVGPDEMTEKEIVELRQLINANLFYIAGFGQAIEAQSKANKGKLGPHMTRANMWVNRYNDVKNQAKLSACGDKKLKWVRNPAKDSCTTCIKLSGKIKRASQWEESGWRPQSQRLKCGGWRCGCSLVPTDEPLSKGPLPSIP